MFCFFINNERIYGLLLLMEKMSDDWRYCSSNLKFISRPNKTFVNSSKMGLDAKKTVANNTGADQPAHPRSLISAFVIRVLESTTSKLATSEISVF